MPEPAPVPKPEPAPKPKPPPKPVEKPPQDLDLSALSKTARKPVKATLDLSSLSKSHADAALDLSALTSAHHARSASSALDLSALSAGGQRSSAAKGASRAETARNARTAVGQSTQLNGASLNMLKDRLAPYWHPLCDVEGAAGVRIVVQIRLTTDHRLIEPLRIISATSSGAGTDVMAAAEKRATGAARAISYADLPSDAPLSFPFSFNAKQACGG
jgi:hypothetical protein